MKKLFLQKRFIKDESANAQIRIRIFFSLKISGNLFLENGVKEIRGKIE